MKKNIGIFLLIVLVLGLAGGGYWWFGQKPKNEANLPLQEVTLKLKWLHQSQFAGNYMAVEKGFFEKQGLNVQIEPFAFGENVVDYVASGKADFGVVGADELAIARSKGINVKAIGVVFKKTPVVAYSLKEKNITKPSDLIGKRVGLQESNNIEYQYAAMLERSGVDRKKIKEVKIGHTADELLAGKVDVATGYVINEPHQVVELGKKVNNILVADYGVNIYADVYFATDETIKNKPELVQKFVTASFKGWQYAIEHESESVTTVMKFAPKNMIAHETYMMQATVPFVNTGIGRLGQMENEVWLRILEILTKGGILKKQVPVADLYTNQFVNQLYR